jgi:rhodanese-related sulfurtransferase
MKHAPAFLRLVESVRPRIRECHVADVQRRLGAGKRFHLIDVRERDEWDRGHLPHATHLSKGVIERDIEAVVPDLDADIVLYCGGGFRSALAADALQQMGYRRVVSMDGGWRGWTEAGYETVRG